MVCYALMIMVNSVSHDAWSQDQETTIDLKDYHLPEEPMRPFYGSRIQRTMALLETSNPENPNKVKILFYGQSIVANMHSYKIIEALRARYPTARIGYESRAIGGFQAPFLYRTAIHDLYPYYPDLVVFHVYGGAKTGDLERILYNIKKYTTSEVMLFNHQVAWKSEPEALKERNRRDDIGSDYLELMAQKYHYEFVDVRRYWKKFLSLNENVNINTLMGDTVHSNVHPNKFGNALLRYFILQHFHYNPYTAHNSFDDIRDYEARRFVVEKQDEMVIEGDYELAEGGVILSKGSEISLEFNGNKAELFTFAAEAEGKMKVTIDGREPSAHKRMYYITRPTKAYKNWMPALKRVSFGEAFPILESYKLKLFDFNRQDQIFHFELYGSTAGFDGKGSNKQDFVSNSGRISIDKDDFIIFLTESISKSETPENFEIRFDVKPLFNDILVVTDTTSSYRIAQGLANRKHQLKLQVIEGQVPVQFIRVHTPEIQ